MTVMRSDLFPRHDDFFDLCVVRYWVAHPHRPRHVLPLGSTACVDGRRESGTITLGDNLHLRMPALEQIIDSHAAVLDLIGDPAFAPVGMKLQRGALSHRAASRR